MTALTNSTARGLALGALMSCFLLLTACETGKKNNPDPTPSGTAASMRSRINTFRTDSGLAALTSDTMLNSVAQAQATYNAGIGSHSATNGAGETIAQQLTAEGYAHSSTAYLFHNLSESASFNEWSTNAAYSGIILDPGFTDFGVGVATQANGTTRWVAIFAAKDAPTTGTVAEMLDAINAFRALEGTAAVVLNADLSDVAQAQAVHNASVQAHEDETGGLSVLEQIEATGYTHGLIMWPRSNGGVDQAFEGWTDTQAEADLMREARFEDAGIGVAVGGNKQWWVVIMAEPVTP